MCFTASQSWSCNALHLALLKTLFASGPFQWPAAPWQDTQYVKRQDVTPQGFTNSVDTVFTNDYLIWFSDQFNTLLWPSGISTACLVFFRAMSTLAKKMQEQCQSERNAENSLDNQVGVYVYFHFPSNFKFRMELFLFMTFMCQTLCAFIFRFTQQKSTESRRDEPSIAEHLRTSCPFPLPSLWSLYLWLCWWRRVGLCTVVPEILSDSLDHFRHL